MGKQESDYFVFSNFGVRSVTVIIINVINKTVDGKNNCKSKIKYNNQKCFTNLNTENTYNII